jgi:pilus assembly protein Flp/PilA
MPVASAASSARRRFARRDDAGASAVEYALILAGIAAVVVAIVFALGSVLHGSVQHSCDTIKGQFDGSTSAACQ